MAQLTWLVTGCSSGFGESFVHAILARGDKVIATGRKSAERLAHLKDSGAAILDLDVTWSQQEIDSTIEKAIEIYGGIDVLVSDTLHYLLFGNCFSSCCGNSLRYREGTSHGEKGLDCA